MRIKTTQKGLFPPQASGWVFRGPGLAHPKSRYPTTFIIRRGLETLNSAVDGPLRRLWARRRLCEEVRMALAVNTVFGAVLLCLGFGLRFSYCITCGLRNTGPLSLIQHHRSVLSSHIGAVSREIQGASFVSRIQKRSHAAVSAVTAR